MPIPEVSGKRILAYSLGKCFLEQLLEGLDAFAAVLELDAGVDIFGVLAEDDHVHVLGVLDRGGHALEVAHRAQADVQIQLFAQGHVQRADPAADGRGQRAFDAHQVLAEGGQGLLGQPAAGLVEGFLAGQHFHPGDLARAAVGFLHRRVEHGLGGAPDIRAGAVALDEGQDGVGGHLQPAVVHDDFFTVDVAHGRTPLGLNFT